MLDAPPPALGVRHAEEIARTRYGLDATAEPLVSERDQNFRLTDDSGAAWVLKVSNAAEDRGVVEMEVAAVDWIASVDPGLPVPVARPALDGSAVTTPWWTTPAPGPPASAPAGALRRADRAGSCGRDPPRGGGGPHRSGAARASSTPSAGRTIWWDQRHLPDLARRVSLTDGPERRELLGRVLERFQRRVVPALPTLRSQLIHNDVTLDNLLLDGDDRVTGIIDFGDMAHTALILDVPATLQSLVRDREDLFEVTDAFVAGYASVLPLEEAEAQLLGDLLAGRMAQTILISAWRMPQHPDNDYIRGWAGPAWELLEQMEAIGFDEVSRRMAAIAGRRSDRHTADDQLLARRHRVLGTALESLSYRDPLHLVRGDGAWMEAADGRRYLDAYNNVPVVGHAHPRVVAAIARQAATLNTNTRYLHEHVVALAERLVATMPDGLDTVLFVNSGSEANDLAWRLATMYTGADAGLATAWSYHGVTAAVADVTASEWPDGKQPDGVEVFDAPDTYRGPLRRCGRSRRRRPCRDRGGGGPPGGTRAASGGAVSSTRPSPPTASSCPNPRRGRDRGCRARCGRPLRCRRGAVGPRPDRRAVGLLPLGRDAGHRHPGQADGQRPSHRGGHHPRRDRRPLRRPHDLLLDFRRQPGGVCGGAGRARRPRGEGLVARAADRRRSAALRAGGAGGPS